MIYENKLEIMNDDEFNYLQLNASGLMLTSKKSIGIENRLINCSKNIYGKTAINECYFDKDNSFGLITFKIEKNSSWNPSYKNVIYHYIFIYQNTINKNNYVFIGFSDSSKFKTIFRFINDKEKLKVEKIDTIKLKNAFLLNKIHTIWMKNHSKKTVYKPDNKILIGNIDNILNPIMDSSFSFSSAKGTLNDDKIIINPYNSKFFFKKSNSILDLKSIFNDIINYLEELKQPKKNNFKFNYLLEEISDIKFSKTFDKLIDFSFQDPDWIKSLDYFNENLTYEDYCRITENISIEILGNPLKSPSKIKDGFFASINITYKNITLNLSFYQILRGLYSCFYPCNENLEKSFPEDAKLIQYIFKSKFLLKFYFKSGYIIDGDQIFKVDYQTIDYSDNKILTNQFKDINIDKEKPTKINNINFDPTEIGKQKSLFCWTVKNWKQDILNNNYNIKNELLLCDDGSNEVCDFLHLVELEENQYILNIIHIKAAKTLSDKRKVAVGAFDLVLTQAIKNARYSDISELYNKLSTRDSNINTIWENNKESSTKNRKNFIEKLKSIEQEAHSYETNIIVIQPHLKKTNYKKLNKNSNTKKLLNTLLHSANNAISGFSSSLYIMISE